MLEEADGGVARLDPSGNSEAEVLTVDRSQESSATVTWKFNWYQAKQKQKCLQSKYVEVGGKDCRLLVYPFGDTQALPGYVSFYLQLQDPNNAANNRWDCFASYKLSVQNQLSPDLDLSRESWHRFSSRPARQQARPLSSSSHGWADFASASQIQDPKAGFVVNGFVTVSATVLVLKETLQFVREGDSSSDNLSGKFTWRVKNFELFREMIKVQKIMSPPFAAGDCSLRISVYQSPVNSSEHLSLCLESKDTDSAGGADQERTCWCLFRLSVVSQKEGGKNFQRESYGRFSTDLKQTDSASLGWNDFLSMDTFTDPSQGYLQDGTAVFQAAFQGIKETASFHRGCAIKELGFFGRQAPRRLGGVATGKAAKALNGPAGTDSFQATFVWRIEHFTRLKDLLKKRKITGLCVKSKRFFVGGCTCRLIVYPRGQSQPPRHLSMFLEVSDKDATADWSCFVSHRLVIVNQRDESRSLVKESQNRYMKAAKDWGWREFVTLHTLFDADAGFLVNDDCVFAAEVLMLRESSEAKQVPVEDKLQGVTALALPPPPPEAAVDESKARGTKVRFTWRLDNFAAFRTILETRKVFSRFFAAEGCKLRLGTYTSYNTMCTYLESDSTAAAAEKGQERNFWVKSRVAVLNQRYPERTEWKESAICTKTWNNSVLQLVQIDELMNPESGYLVKDGLVLCVEVLECCPWFEFADLDKYASDEEAGASLSESEDSASVSEVTECSTSSVQDAAEPFWMMMGRTGLGIGPNQPPLSLEGARSLQSMLADQLKDDDEAVDAYVAGLCAYMDSPSRVKRLLLPLSGQDSAATQQLCLLDFLCTVVPLRDSMVRLVLDKMVQCCSPGQPGSAMPLLPARPPKHHNRVSEAGAPAAAERHAAQRKDRGERRQPVKVRTGGACVSGEEATDAARSRTPMPPPEENKHMMRDSRRNEEESASCSTLVVGEEPALRPAVPRALHAATRSLTDGEQSLTAESALSAEIESVDTDASGDAVPERGPAATGADHPVPPPFLFGKPKPPRAPTGRPPSDAESEEGREKHSNAEESPERFYSCSANDTANDGSDPDFNALLEDIATGPLHGSTPAAAAAAAHEAPDPSLAAARTAAAATQPKAPARLKPNPLRGFLSRRLPQSQPPAAQQPLVPTTPQSAHPGSPHPAIQTPSEPVMSGLPAQQQQPESDVGVQTQPESAQVQPESAEGVHELQPQPGSAGDAGKAAPEGDDQDAERAEEQRKEDSQEVLSLAMVWLHRMYCDFGGSDIRETLPADEAFDRIAALLPRLPNPLKPELLMLIPSMVDVVEHINAADELLKCLTGKPEARFVLDAALQLPAIVALSMLRLQGALTDTVLSVILAALESASVQDRPLLMGLTLRLASDGDASACAKVVDAACEHICSGSDNLAACPLAMSEVLRSALLHHSRIAEAAVAVLQKRLRGREQATPPGKPRQPTGNAALDADLCLQLLHVPAARNGTVQAVVRALSHGALTKEELVAAVGRNVAKKRLGSSSSGADTPSPPLGPSTPAESPEPKQLVQEAVEAVEGPSVPSWHRLVALDLSAARVAEPEKEAEHLLWLAEKLTAVADASVRSAGSHLYITVSRIFPSAAIQERLLRTLVDRALTAAAPPAQPAASAQRPAQNARKGGKGASAQQQPQQQAEQPKQEAASQAATEVLLELAEEPSCSRSALKLVLEQASSPNRELEKLSQQLQAAQKDLEAARNAEASARSKAATEAKLRATQKAETDAAAANLRSEHAAELARLAAARKKLESRCEQLEKEVEWVKSERDEAVKAAEAATARQKESEAAAARAKNTRRDELKKEKKDRNALQHRAEAAEAAKRKAEEEVAKVRATASAAAERAEAQLRTVQERLQAAETSAKMHEAEVGQLTDTVKELGGQLARAQALQQQQESVLALEKERLGPYFGQGLERLTKADLEALNAFHYKAINRLQPFLGKVGQVQDANADEEEAAAQAQAVAVALAESVAGSPQARSVCATPPPHTPYASSGGTTPQYDRMSARGAGGLRSMGSIDSQSSQESMRVLAHAFTEATATPNGIPKSPSCFPANGGTYPAAGGIPALPIANGNTVKDARAPIGAAMPGRPQPRDAALAGSNAPGGKLGPLHSPFKITPATRGPVLKGAPSAIGPPGGKAPGQNAPVRTRHHEAVGPGAVPSANNARPGNAPPDAGTQPRQVLGGGTMDYRRMRVNADPEQLWNQYKQQQDREQADSVSSSTGHPLSSQLPRSLGLWSRSESNNGVNGTHQMW